MGQYMRSLAGEYLVAALWSVPEILLFITGLVLGIKHWKNKPKASKFAVLGFSSLILSTTVTRIVPYLRISMLNGSINPFSNTVTTIFNTFSVICIIVLPIVGWICLLIALFGRNNDI